ncbi:MAG: AMP-binding protein [Flavisolibacter sp.]
MDNIFDLFSESCRRYPDASCLSVEGKVYTYSEISQKVDKISELLEEISGELVAIYADKSLICYISILATLKSGFGYVPINPKFPAFKNKAILEVAKASAIIVSQSSYQFIEDFLPSYHLNIICPESGKISDEIAREEHYMPVFHAKNVAGYGSEKGNVEVKIAYLLFTSGSTGIPKGVPVTHGNVLAYILNVLKRFEFNCSDRFSQIFDLTFDLSVHDMFVCFAVGGTLCIPPGKYFSPVEYIKSRQITVWFSVPSYASVIVNSKVFNSNMFPSIRYSLFCGEPLTTIVAEKWQAASPKSWLINLYGPTETTIAIAGYNVMKGKSIKSLYGFVSIGKLFDDQSYLIMADKRIAKVNERGELYLAGSQVVHGYWKDELLTNKKFIQLNNSIYFLTGDVVMQDEDGDIFYIERKDFQIKVRGYRIELEEINHLIKTTFGLQDVITVPIGDNGVYDKVVTFILHLSNLEEVKILGVCKERLPHYMVPEKVVFLDEFPLNNNGKIDRFELLKYANEKLKI